MFVLPVGSERDFVVAIAPVGVDLVVILAVVWVCMVVAAELEAVSLCAVREM